MVMREKEEPGQTPDFPFLRTMKGLRTALIIEVRREFETFDLERLEGADPVVQERIVREALAKAGEVYDKLLYRDKTEQLRQVVEAFQEGRLSVTGLLQGLELKPKTEAGKDGGFLGKIRGIFSKP